MDQIKKERNQRIWRSVLLGAILLLANYGFAVLSEATAQQSFSNFGTFYNTAMAWRVLVNTAVLLTLLMGTLYLFIRRLWVSLVLVWVPFYALHIISSFKLLFRNEPLYPWDLSLAAEVSNIVGSMKITFSLPLTLGIAALVVGLVLAILSDCLWLKKGRLPAKRASLWGLGCLAVFVGCGVLLLGKGYLAAHGIDTISYDQKTSYHQNGFVYSFTSNIYKSKVTAPLGYSEDMMTDLAFEYNNKGTATKENPNVIIVMSEAFGDIWNAENLQFEKEVAPNYKALSEKYLSGNAMTSEFGGNTANCEFEVLTAYSTALLPSGTVAYMNYINSGIESYVSYLNERNYYTVALHPYLRSFFSREKAYEVLGFDDFYSEEHFDTSKRARAMQYITDDEVVDRIIEEYEKNEKSKSPFFCHTVTMLNHASYFEHDYPVEEQIDFTASCELNEEEYNTIRSYATGLSLADAALGKLVDYFEQVEEPTVILFFGDHQPSLYGNTRELMTRIGYAADQESAEGLMTLQSTPYLIWNNFEKNPTHAEEDMSMFHLLPYMTRTLHMARPDYFAYMDSLFEKVHGFTRYVSCDAEGKPVKELSAEAQKKIDEYLMLVYDGLMGKRYGNFILY